MIAIALMLSMITADAQTLTGCFGVQFSASIEQVKQMMKDKHSDAELLRDDPTFIAYIKGEWAGRKAYIWAFSFNDKGQLHTASVTLKPEKESGIFELYDAVSSDLAEKYGSPKGDVERWSYPYTASDKYAHGITALKLGKAKIQKTWWFENGSQTDDDDNAIQINITDDPYVNIRYQDGVLIQDVVKKNAESRKNDM